MSWYEGEAMDQGWYEIIHHTADVGLRVHGPHLRHVFEKAALGFYDLMAGLTAIEERQVRHVHVEAEALDELLVRWLSELLYLFDVENFLGKKVAVVLEPSWHVKATVHGEVFDPQRHELKLLYKAVTYHMASVEFRNGFWTAQVIFDI
ncbi:archease [Desulfosoma caldarium]|uniref:SHS2 domain-containing protein n=1 Tax=Desulfosoma caldarium TaxID=610254 RepID=A0A3N1UFT7_9BACT|nr:archease [Desulfosoma caldarium]ROQ90192.1 SHS2 domain-containing protein [Desulfosoma caldarium]